MKKILLIVNGLIAQEFLKRISNDFLNTNEYSVVYFEDDILPERKVEHFKYFKFDPTSYAKLSSLLKKENFFQVLIILSNKTDVEEVIKNVKMVRKDIAISIMDRWNLKLEEKNISMKNIQRININDVITNRLVHTLPNVPVIAQNIGLGKGEIMEVSVPFTSSYVYRHISSIEQKNWKIAGVYRNSQFIVAKDSFMIQPNDILLMVGAASVLKQVYRAIKRDIGQFPAPFGSNIYVLIDMRFDNTKSIKSSLNSAKYLHSKLKNKKVIVKILNPNSLKLLEFIKSYDESFTVCINYFAKTLSEQIYLDSKSYNIGLIIVSSRVFRNRRFKTTLYLSGFPVLKVGKKDIEDVKDAIVILSKNENLERTSSIMFDISSQLNLNMKLLDFDPEGEFKEKTVEFFQNISRIFSKNIDTISVNANPIREAKKIENFLHFVPFTEDIIDSNIFSIFSGNVEKLYYKLDDYNQLFIPVLI